MQVPEPVQSVLDGRTKIGTVERGKLADLVVSKTNPLKDIKSLGNPENIGMVLKGGEVFKYSF